jgi:hypothetical protein
MNSCGGAYLAPPPWLAVLESSPLERSCLNHV